MKNKLTFLIVTVAVVIGFILLLTNRSPVSTDSVVASVGITSGSFGAAIPEFDFGSVSMAKGKISHDFEIKNDTDSEIAITRAATSCMCTEAVLSLSSGEKFGPFGMPGHGMMPTLDIRVKPGEMLAVSAIFDPAAHGPAGIGPVGRRVMLETSKGQMNMDFKAQVTP